MKRRMRQRINSHKIDQRFCDDEFDVQVLEESEDRSYIERMEEEYIKKYDTYNNGLNKSKSGKGYGHNSPKFNTLGYQFTEEQRKNMSKAAKKRAQREGHEKRSENCRKPWLDPKYRKHQSNVRKNKRLTPPKISDDQVDEIRKIWDEERSSIQESLVKYNEKQRSLGRMEMTPEGHFSQKYAPHYNVTPVTIKNIITWKSRTKVLPAIYKS